MFKNQHKKLYVTEIDGTPLQYELRQSKKAQKITLSISAQGKLKLTVPDRFCLDNMDEVIFRHRDWISSHMDKFFDSCGKESVRELLAGDRIPYLGSNYMLVIEENSGNRITLVLEKDMFRLSVPCFLKGEGRAAEMRRIFELWFARQAKTVIPQRVAEINRNFGFAYNRIAIRNQQTRWGSCSQLRNLNFNWRLLLAPREILDYVIVHELAHLKELNHSKNFWQLVESGCANFKHARNWLKKHGHTLKI